MLHVHAAACICSLLVHMICYAMLCDAMLCYAMCTVCGPWDIHGTHTACSCSVCSVFMLRQSAGCRQMETRRLAVLDVKLDLGLKRWILLLKFDDFCPRHSLTYFSINYALSILYDNALTLILMYG